MKLTIVYHIYKNTTNLKSSLENIFNQKQRDFEFVLVNDSASPSVLQIIKKFDFLKLKHFSYYDFSQNMGHSFSFNSAVKQAKGEYVYYCGSNIILQKDFVSVIYSIIDKHKNVDVISFTNRDNGGKNMEFTKLNKSLELFVPISMKYAIMRKSMLINNSIFLNEEHYFPLIFICRLLMTFKKWVVYQNTLAQFHANKFYAYDLYDVFAQNTLLIQNYKNSIFYKQHSDFLEYCMTIFILLFFLPRVFFSYSDRKARWIALSHAQEWLTKNLPAFRNNKLINHKNKIYLSNECVSYIKKMKFNARYVNKFIKSKGFENL